MVLIHSSSLPSVVSNWINPNNTLPPFSLVFMVWTGLLILFIKAIRDRDILYVYGNGAGLLVNTLTLSFILLR